MQTKLSMKINRYISFGFLISLFVIGYFVFKYLQKENVYTSVEKINYTQEYVGSSSCKECHQVEYDQWKQSDHYQAMQEADSISVLGNFDNVTYTADGVTSHFFKKNGKYYINTQGDDGKNRDFQVLYTFGYYPLQQYLTAFEGGRLQVFRQSWDSQKKRWFHQYKNQIIPHNDWLHWTGNAQNWNMMCSTCHSTNLQKNYNSHTDIYQTSYSEQTIGCESCHGAGAKHISYIKSADYQQGASLDLFIKAKKSEEQNASLQTCFPCHSRRGELSAEKIASAEILDNYIYEIPAKDLYFPDGQALDEVYKYSSFLQSKMYLSGVKCIDCHNPHSGKLKLEKDKVCMQCHTPNYASSNHTFHLENTEASDCRSCHMPTRVYMGNDVRHDHNFAVPRPDLSEKYNVPNACNQCHTDKSAQWARQAIEKWYGKDRKPHFAEDLILGSYRNEKSLSHLSKLLSDKNTPVIIRATAVHYLADIPTQDSFRLIEKELQSTDAQTRYRALLSLMNFPISSIQNKIIPLLKDDVRAVRIATANLLLTQLGKKQAQQLSDFEKARKELETFVLFQSDFATGSAIAGDYYVKMENIPQAIFFYKRALKKDAKLTYVRLNVATLYNQIGANDRALEVLQQALTYQANNAQVHYYLALLYNELNQLSIAKNHFEKAKKCGMNTESLQRNYLLLLEKMRE